MHGLDVELDRELLSENEPAGDGRRI